MDPKQKSLDIARSCEAIKQTRSNEVQSKGGNERTKVKLPKIFFSCGQLATALTTKFRSLFFFTGCLLSLNLKLSKISSKVQLTVAYNSMRT